MSRILITGSSEGLGLMADQFLASEGHSVVLHARNQQRSDDARRALPQAEQILIGDLSSLAQTRSLADQANRSGPFDAVIHNAGIGYQERRLTKTEDGLSHVFQINTLAPYVLTALIEKPKRLIYLSSGLHKGADPSLDDILWNERTWMGFEAYSESKFYDVLLAFAVARRWPMVFSNAIEPGWVATRMGGDGAKDDLNEGFRTQSWLAVSDDAGAKVSGQYFFHKKLREPARETRDVELQDRLLAICEKLSGVKLAGVTPANEAK